MHTLRTRFKKEIVCEFLPPTRKSDRVVIFCHGMPTVPKDRELIEFFAKKGYWFFFPRYRGEWESDGSFLKVSPEKDILDIIDQLPRGFTSIADKKKYKVSPKKIYLIGGSFGGPAAILASRDKRVTKVIAVSPVVDWRFPSKAEPLGWLYKYTQEAFGKGYRITKKNWDKLKSGRFYNPVRHIKEIDGQKLFIIHARDDDSVGWRSVQKFARITGSKLLMLKRGGHLSSSILMKPSHWKRFQKFIRK